jgi:O-antigen/teichoic acid export membrane protein
MPLYNNSRARRSVVDTLLYRIISQIATLASYVVLVRGLGEHEFGVLSLLYALIPVLSTVASFGVEQVLRRYEPEYLHAGNVQGAAWLVRVVASIRFGSNVVLLALIGLLWNWIAPIFQLNAYRLEYVYFCALLLMHFQANILQLTLSSHLMQRHAIGMTAAQSAAKFVLYVMFLYFGKMTLNLAILSDTIGYAILYGGTRFAYVRHCRPPPAAQPYQVNRAERRRLLRYGFYNNFNDAGTLILSSRSDNFFIAAYLNPIAVGAYSFYTRLNEMMLSVLPLRQFNNVIRPFVFAVPQEQAAERLPRYFTLLVNLTLCVQLPIAAFAITYHEEIVRVLFGGKFLGSSGLLSVVVGFSVLAVTGDPVALIAQHAERAAVMLLSKIFIFYNVAAMLVLLPVLGLYGAAIATGTAILFKNVFIWWQVRSLARWTNFPAVAAMSMLIWGSTIGVCYALKHLLLVPTIVQMLIGAVLCTVSSFLYVRSPAMAASDRRLLSQVLHGRESRLLQWLGIVGPVASAPRGA